MTVAAHCGGKLRMSAAARVDSVKLPGTGGPAPVTLRTVIVSVLCTAVHVGACVESVHVSVYQENAYWFCMIVHICVCMYACMYVCIYVCMYVCIYVCMYVSLFVYLYVRMYACMHVCMSFMYVLCTQASDHGMAT